MGVTQTTGTQIKDGTVGVIDMSATGSPSTTTFLRGDNTWATPITGVTLLSAIGSTPNANGATITGNVLMLQPADGTNGGILTNTTQTITGNKIFTNDLQSGTDTVGIKLKNVSNYRGIWFDQTTPTLTNYNFLYDYSAGNKTILNGPGGVDIRANGNYASGSLRLDTNGVTYINAAYNTVPVGTEKLNVNGNILIVTLATGLTAPTTTGTVKMVIVDTNGLLSNAIIPTGGAGSGITRSINNITTTTTGAAIAVTDYVYFANGTFTFTLPTAIGNTNLYTIKNTGTGIISIATTLSQTIDAGTAPITISRTNNSLDFISDGSNWKIV